MKNKIKRRSVTTELFIIYFLGYTCLSIIIFSSTNISFKIYKFLCSQRTYNSIYFDNLEDKLETNYLDVTDRDLSVIKGFLITINNDNKIDYHKGCLIDEFDQMNLNDYMGLFGVNKNNIILVNSDMRARSILKNFNNTIVDLNNGEKYSIYTKYIKKKNKMLVIGCPYIQITQPNVVTNIISVHRIIQILAFANVVIVLLLVYVLAEKTSSNFIMPIRKMIKGVNEISNGNYNVRLGDNKINEFIELSQGFNNMAETIQKEQSEKRKLEKLREELILDISHDLKNPLSSILGYSETLLKDSNISEDEKNKYLNIINQNSYRANKLITDLFEFSLYENCNYKMELKKTDICELLRIIIAGYINEFDYKGFEYEFDISEDEYHIMIDELKFTRAINNILDNKIKYNDRGNKIYIKTYAKNNNFYIILGDNGHAIPKELRDNIFNPFVRTDKSRNSKTGGTGLGLSITKKIINKHNGDIKIIDSDCGTNFEINIPLSH
ncbi:HAMP domain-containing sensor histidine kinase [Clostridium sp. SM-530-WT-3G]|uniref:sensor histidine kinase n=1 Tax=Clostridium sp. SM-530-WT-3G TaxID=2725303 RepID=UPI00145FD17C|nr:HAMP domain-containing sensor histidine kinase [Clostridium sp. SM-530-WT-3G]NME82672.1 HAMP domain-containing histidine kinase [Clostridium sp. SM-530-WT-3G]